MALNSYQAKRIPMADVLAQLGYQPHHEKKQELWYCSPFRHESVPSFKVNIARNIWYDFGEGQGGTTLDFMVKYRQLGSIAEALDELESLNLNQPPLELSTPKLAVALSSRKTSTSESNSSPEATITSLQHRALVRYLNERGITAAIAAPYLQEIHYTRNGKNYFALAFKNDAGGYEMRNAYFKGTYGVKDITLLPTEEGTGRRVAIFEGFIDFLSALTLNEFPHVRPSVLVLNSNALRERAITAVNTLAEMTVGIDLYLDHDKNGRDLTEYLRRALSGFDVADRSRLYIDHKDVNDYLTFQSPPLNPS